jgi:hypothetical protein
LAIAMACTITETLAQITFYFAITHRRMPSAIFILLVLLPITYLPTGVNVLFAANQPAWAGPLNQAYFLPLVRLDHVALTFAPFLAFWPASGIPRRMRPIAFLSMLWSSFDFIWWLLPRTNFPLFGRLGVPNISLRWELVVLDARGFAIAGVLVALLALLFREHRQVSLERAVLVGEMQAAQEIQRALVPALIESLPSLQIDVAFRPVREVGGDFYNCRILPGNRQRILLGDVSGKGAAAAMTAAVIIGAAELRDSDSPGQILGHLNQVLKRNRIGGFATCLCADVESDGIVTIANAGHLSPYRHGEEITIPSGLPLGLNAGGAAEYEETNFKFELGDRLTLVSDGVVEARNSSGELFGFDRTRAISAQSADQIAQAAQAHGQEDDITVLTLTFAPVGVAHA